MTGLLLLLLAAEHASAAPYTGPSPDLSFWSSILTNADEQPLAEHRALRVIRFPEALVSATVVTVRPGSKGAILRVCQLRDRRSPGCVAESWSVSEGEYAELAVLARAGLWSKAQVAPTGRPELLDGVSWFIEGYREGQRWVIVRHEPTDPDVVAFLNEVMLLARLPDLKAQ